MAQEVAIKPSSVTKKFNDNGRPFYEIVGHKMIWRNFEGKLGRFNAEGQKNFNIVLDKEGAEFLMDEGFKVKFKEPKIEGEEGIYTLKINVNFGGYKAPEIWMKNNHGNTQLNKDDVKILDWADIVEYFLVFNPNIKPDSMTAYLDKLLCTVQESEYESQFFDEEDSATNTMTFHKIPQLSEADDVEVLDID
jgi:hypothetical protein